MSGDEAPNAVDHAFNIQFVEVLRAPVCRLAALGVPARWREVAIAMTGLDDRRRMKGIVTATAVV